MHFRAFSWTLLTLLLASNCWAQTPAAPVAASSSKPDASASAQTPTLSAEDELQQQRVNDAARLVASGKTQEAITTDLDKVIAAFEEKYGNSKEKLYSARTLSESLMYLAESAKTNTDSKVLPVFWAYAFYIKGFALIDLRRPAEALPLFNKAIALAPHNAQFLDELANFYQNNKNWTKALETYQLAESAANEFSPPVTKNKELSRAWRGIGFVYVEMHRLEEAEKQYLKCLELDKNDATAARELAYVRRLRSNSSALPSVEPYTHSGTGVVFPAKLLNYDRGEIQNMEQTNPGQGVRIAYSYPGYFFGELYIGSNGLNPVPATLTDPAMETLRANEVAALLAQARQGIGTDLTRKTGSLTGELPISGAKIPYLWDMFIVYPGGRATNENLYIWLAKGTIWKLRITRMPDNRTNEAPVELLKAMMALSLGDKQP